MLTLTVQEIIDAHRPSHETILKSIAERNQRQSNGSTVHAPLYLQLPQAKACQKHVFERFAHVIATPSFDYVSKTDKGWLIVGDNRPEIAARISLIIEQYGLGIGMMVLHAQQMNSQHILLEIDSDGQKLNLAQPTPVLYGAQGEHVLYVPIRRHRGDAVKLAEFNIVKPKELWDDSQIVKHQDAPEPFCYYCSAREINPAEVVVNIQGKRLGLARNYSLGFTFAPFGNPLTVMHFLAWDYAANPLNMNRTPMTVSDLVEMTRQVNISIIEFFAGSGITDYPVIDGVSNGWAGNSIYHQHFQFYQPEYDSPIKSGHLVIRHPLLVRDDIRVHKLSWPAPLYRVCADDAMNVGLVGNDMAGIWRLQGSSRHTQNIYVTGRDLGKTAFIILRDRKQVDYLPTETELVNQKRKRKAQRKTNIGVLEVAGMVMVNDKASFDEMGTWEPADISEQIRRMANAAAPSDARVEKFEQSIKALFP